MKTNSCFVVFSLSKYHSKNVSQLEIMQQKKFSADQCVKSYNGSKKIFVFLLHQQLGLLQSGLWDPHGQKMKTYFMWKGGLFHLLLRGKVAILDLFYGPPPKSSIFKRGLSPKKYRLLSSSFSWDGQHIVSHVDLWQLSGHFAMSFSLSSPRNTLLCSKITKIHLRLGFQKAFSLQKHFVKVFEQEIFISVAFEGSR